MTRPPSDQPTSGEPAADGTAPDAVRSVDLGKDASTASRDPRPAAGDAGWDDERRDTGPVPVVAPTAAPAGRPSGAGRAAGPWSPSGPVPTAGPRSGTFPSTGPGAGTSAPFGAASAPPPMAPPGFGAGFAAGSGSPFGSPSGPAPHPAAAPHGAPAPHQAQAPHQAPPGAPASPLPGQPWVSTPGARPHGATAAAPRRSEIGTTRALSAVVAALGVVNLVAGFLPEVALPASGRQVVESVSVFAVGPGWVPLLLLTGGLLAAAAFLPGGGDHRFAAAAVSVAGAVGAVVALGVPNGFEQLLGASLGNGAGALLLFVGGTIQAVVAVAALVLSATGGTASVPGESTRPGGPGAAGPVPAGPWPAGASPAGGVAPGFGPGPAAPVQPWSGAAGFGPSAAGTPNGPVATPPRSTPAAFADDRRSTGPIPTAQPDLPPDPSPGERAGQHWAGPDDVTVSTRSRDRPRGGDNPDAR